MSILSKIICAIIFLIAALLHEVPCFGQEQQPLVQWEQGYPAPGDSTRFTYRAGAGPLQVKAVRCVVYYFVQEQLQAIDVHLKRNGQTVQGAFRLPLNTQCVALKFTAGRFTDSNGGKGYIYPMQRNGVPVRGALGTEAICRASFGIHALGLSPAPEKVLALLEKERQRYPSEWAASFSRFNLTATVMAGPAEKATAIIEQAYRDSLATGNCTEAGLSGFQALFFQLKRPDLADTVQRGILSRFPDGEVAYTIASFALRRYNTLTELETAVAAFQKRFALLQSSIGPAREGLLYAMLAEKALAEQESERFYKYMNSMQYQEDRFAFCHQMAKQLAEESDRLPLADTLAGMASRFAYERLNMCEGKPVGMSLHEWKESLKTTYADYANTYALIAGKRGKVQEALAIQRQMMAQAGELATSDMYNHYLGNLVAVKDYDEAFRVAAAMIQMDYYSAASKEKIREVYQHRKGTAAGFDGWFTALEAGAVQKRRDLLRSEMMDLPAADFMLKDLAGNPVSLASLKGKVVVLDFWATWCGPCKASMPGMQEAVNHFSKDTNVVFLFVNTREKTTQDTREKQVKAFLQKQQYTFRVLYDEPADETKKTFKIVDAYKITGIPTKLVIDQNGKIRFRSVGFHGDNTSLTKEVVAMVGLLTSGS